MHEYTPSILFTCVVVLGVGLYLGIRQDKKNRQECQKRVDALVQYIDTQNESKFKMDQFQADLLAQRESDVAWFRPRYVARADMNRELVTDQVQVTQLQGTRVTAPQVQYQKIIY